MSGYSDYIVPLIILAVTVAGIIKKTDIFVPVLPSLQT